MKTFVVLSGLLLALASSAQETVPYRPPARDFSVQVNGEYIRYLPDGGCSGTADSRLSTAAVALDAGTCAQSRARTTAQARVAIDGGALELNP